MIFRTIALCAALCSAACSNSDDADDSDDPLTTSNGSGGSGDPATTISGDSGTGTTSPSEPISSTEEACDDCVDQSCVEAFEITTAQHLEGDLVYDDVPPVGGDHNLCWAEWGVH